MRREMLMEETGEQAVEVARRVLSLADAVGSVRIRHEGEGFVVDDELIDERFRSLVVNIVISGSMDQQQMTLQLIGVVER